MAGHEIYVPQKGEKEEGKTSLLTQIMFSLRLFLKEFSAQPSNFLPTLDSIFLLYTTAYYQNLGLVLFSILEEPNVSVFIVSIFKT